MEIYYKIVKDIPREKIRKFEDRTVYNTAVYTREMTKTSSSYPYLTGRLARTEASNPIVGSNCNYSLTAGIDYALYVWEMNSVNWTNSSTQPQWYLTNFRNKKEIIINQAVNNALKEV